MTSIPYDQDVHHTAPRRDALHAVSCPRVVASSPPHRPPPIVDVRRTRHTRTAPRRDALHAVSCPRVVASSPPHRPPPIVDVGASGTPAPRPGGTRYMPCRALASSHPRLLTAHRPLLMSAHPARPHRAPEGRATCRVVPSRRRILASSPSAISLTPAHAPEGRTTNVLTRRCENASRIPKKFSPTPHPQNGRLTSDQQL